MSLINDALKRARETQPTNPPSGAPPLPPVEPPPHNGFNWMLPAAFILALLVVACIFMGVALMERPAEPVVAKKADPKPSAPVPIQPVSQTPPVQPAPPPVQAAAPVPAPALAPAVAPIPVAPPPVAAKPAPATNAATPALKIQGIIFDPKHPTAIVNGKSLGVGDSIGEFRVKAISSTSIQLQRPDGSQKTLKVGE